MSRGLDNFNSRYVYRVLRPNEDYKSDLTCCAPRSRRTVDEHVATGLKDPSRFISTTSSRERALKWLETANENSSWRYNNSREMIVRIDVDLIKSEYPELSDSAYDLTNDRNRNHFLSSIKQRKFSAAYNEVVFKDIIPLEAVSLEYVRGIGTVRSTKARAPSSTTIKPVSLHTTPPVYHEPSVAGRSMPITNLPNNTKVLGTQSSYSAKRTPSTNSDVIQQSYFPSVLSHDKPVVNDLRNIDPRKVTSRRAGSSAERTYSSILRNYDSSHLVPPSTYHDKLFVPDVMERKIPKVKSRDLSSQTGYLPTRTSHPSTVKTKSQNTDFINPPISTSVLPRTVVKPIAAPRVKRERLNPNYSVSRLGEIRPSVSNNTHRVSENSFPEIEPNEELNSKIDPQNVTQMNSFSFKTLVRRVCCCFCCHVD